MTNPGFEETSKRKRGFPSETHVKKGVRVVHGDKHLEESSGATTPAPAAPRGDFKHCCLKTGAHDGARRNDFFRE